MRSNYKAKLCSPPYLVLQRSDLLLPSSPSTGIIQQCSDVKSISHLLGKYLAGLNRNDQMSVTDKMFLYAEYNVVKSLPADSFSILW